MIKRALVATALAAASLPVAPWAAGVACAGEVASAALVVDTGGSVYSFCVALPDSSVSGIELIELAGDQFNLDYHFGYGGNAVCRLAGVGTSSDDCFDEYPDFWGYWRGDGSGGWTWSGTGAASTTVGEGDVEGWAWGSGDNGSNHPQPPGTTFESVCGAGEEEPSDDPSGDGPGSPARADGGGAPKSDDGGSDADGDENPTGPISTPGSAPTPALEASRDPRAKARDKKSHENRVERGDDDSTAVADANPTPAPGRALDELPAAAQRRPQPFPLAGGIAIVLALALALGGFDAARRRRPARR